MSANAVEYWLISNASDRDATAFVWQLAIARSFPDHDHAMMFAKTRWYLLVQSVTHVGQDERTRSRLMTANSRANNQISAKIFGALYMRVPASVHVQRIRWVSRLGQTRWSFYAFRFHPSSSLEKNASGHDSRSSIDLFGISDIVERVLMFI